MAEMKVMAAPRSVDIAITGRCNLSCGYCFYADEMVARNDLPTDRWLAFFEELGCLSVMDVNLTGGEVFTRHDLFELIDGVISNRMRYSLLSNGTLITEKTLTQFEVGKRRTRLNSIQISIDGSTADVHDQSRPKSFSRAIRGLRLLKEAGYPVTVRVTINRFNVDDLENIARLLFEDVGLSTFGTNEAYPCGATNRFEQGIRLTHAQRVQAMQVLAELNRRYSGRISASAGPLALAYQLEKMFQALAAGHTSMPGRGCLSSCGGVFNRIAIMHDGTIVPCHMVSTLHLGKVGVDALQTVWQHHQILYTMRRRQDLPLEALDTCSGCKYQGFCAGGCPGGSVYLANDVNARSPMDCLRVHLGEDPYLTWDLQELTRQPGSEHGAKDTA